MKGVRRVQAFSCATGLVLSGCYWLAQYDDLSTQFGDGGAHTDAPSGPDGDAGPPFCPADAGPLAYCMDFDEKDAPALPFVVKGASASIVNGPYVSSPNALLVSLTDTASSGEYDVSFPLRPATTRLEFQLQARALDQGITTLAIVLTDASTQTARKLSVVAAQEGSFQVQEYVAVSDAGAQINGHTFYHVATAAAAAWHHVVLTLNVDDANRRYTSSLTVDDQVFESSVPLVLPWAQGEVSLDIGVTYAAEGGKDFFFDNVRADFTP